MQVCIFGQPTVQTATKHAVQTDSQPQVSATSPLDPTPPAQQRAQRAALRDARALRAPAPPQAHDVGGEVLAQQLHRLCPAHAVVHHLCRRREGGRRGQPGGWRWQARVRVGGMVVVELWPHVHPATQLARLSRHSTPAQLPYLVCVGLALVRRRPALRQVRERRRAVGAAGGGQAPGDHFHLAQAGHHLTRGRAAGTGRGWHVAVPSLYRTMSII